MNLPYTSVVEQIHKKIANIKETQEELKKEVDSLVLENLKQQQQKKSNLEKILEALKEKQDKLEKEFQESIKKRCMEAVEWWMSK